VLKTKQLARNPSSHDTYGNSVAWKTAADDVPLGLDSNEFEDWLWKREKKNEPEQPGVFRNQATFPSFFQLPDETDVDDDFFESRDGVNYRPRRHWCFLAEIVDFAKLARLQMEIKDVTGKTIALFFYTGRRGSEIAPSQICKGYTITVLYAQQHAFAFSEPGIRHEDPTLVKVCLLFLPDRLSCGTFLIYLVTPTADISTVARQFAGVERPSPDILDGNEWHENMPRVRQAG
jgi:hypothetical protein